MSSNVLQQSLKLPISARTIRHRALEIGLRARRPAKKPMITKRNQIKRLKFARDHLNWDISKWKTVLFSDESKFNIFGSDGARTVRRPTNQRNNPLYTKKTIKHGGGNVMVWGCFSYNSIGPIHQINGIMDSLHYKSILNDVMLPHLEWEMPLKSIFQHDNDPKHTAKIIKSWSTENRVDVMEWPPQSPDLNPIENLWEIVERAIDRSAVRCKADLFKAISEAWRRIPKIKIKNLIESMPRRCKAVVESKGFATKY